MGIGPRGVSVIGIGVALLVGAPSPGEAPSVLEGTSEGELPVVEVVRPSKDGWKKRVQLPGSLEPYERVELHAKVTGYLEEIRVDIGDRVEKDEILAWLSLPEMKAELHRVRAEVPAARARLVRAQAKAKLAELTLRRLEELRATEPGAVMEQDLDVAASEQEVAASEVALAEAELARARARVEELEAMADYGKIRAPFAGVVVRRFVHPGALVIAGDESTSRPVLSMARGDRLRLVLPVPESLARECRKGLGLSFQIDALPGRAFEANVTRVSGALDPETRTLRAEADVENEEGTLSPGMYARVELDLAGFSEAAVLPAATVRGGTGSPFVYAVTNGSVQRIDVKILKDDGDEVVVSSELLDGAPVVLAGPARLEEGQRVRVVDGSVAP